MRVPLTVLLAAVVLLLAPAVRAQVALPGPADREAIARVITGQIEAFRRDDAAGAFSYAAPNIQAMFGDANHFISMVRRSYPSVYRPNSVQLGTLSMQDGQLVQNVGIIGPDGRAEVALYSMERGSDGIWRISGCQILRAEMNEA